MNALSARAGLSGSLVAIVIALTPSLAWSQSPRLFAGDRAELDGSAPIVVRLGQPLSVPVPDLAIRPGTPDAPVTQICCDKAPCVSDRNAGIGAARSEIIGRYGASWLPTSINTRLDYPGISFRFDDATGSVVEICIPHG